MSNVAQQQVPEGYKQTEVGVVPAEWNIISIERALKANLIVDQMDGNHGELYPKSHEFSHSGVPYVGANDFDGGKVNFKSCKYIAEKRAAHFKKGIAKNGDVLFAHNATVGPVALVETNLEYIILSTTATYYRCDNKSLINKYLKAYFESEHFVGQYTAVMSQSTRNQVPILAQRKFLLVVPPVEEQTAIANALSDADALITSLEKLIAKKRAIKTAAMQQLLTGKKRLPPFDQTHTGYKQTELGEIPEDWEISSLRQICSYINDGTHHTPKYVDNGVPFYSVENVTANDFHNTKFITNEEHERLIKRCKPEKGDILLTRIGTLAKTKLVDWDVDASIYVSLALLKLNDKMDSGYVYSYTKSNRFHTDVKKRSLVNATPQKINMADIGDVPIIYPLSTKEQVEIDSVLSDMDKEIDTLGQRLNKTQQLKQGMMQELLTGRTRLV